MGSKQSKRSVDISGKEGEGVAGSGAGEVVAEGGEGRVEAIADVDALKPQLNGDTPHIEPPEQISDKEKQLENGTPENEKDATTEKETSAAGEAVTNEAEEQDTPKENGDAKSTPEADSNKKVKKDKVGKIRKWSLRSISFSRKEKPKQEKKNKEEETKTNGEADKLPEEAIEATAVVDNQNADSTKEEANDEKTPETPVTEPITNGSSAPETPKEEVSTKEASPVPSPVVDKIEDEVKPVVEAEKTMNGISKEEAEEIKPESTETKTKEVLAPASQDPVPPTHIPEVSEVCVGQSPMTETTPPPLPANPPPSSVTAFAETTMAPHLVESALTKEPEDSPITTVTVSSPPVTDVPQISETVEDKMVKQIQTETEPEIPELPETMTANVGANITQTIEKEEIEISKYSNVDIKVEPSSDILKNFNGSLELKTGDDNIKELLDLEDKVTITNGQTEINGDSGINGSFDDSHSLSDEHSNVITDEAKKIKKPKTVTNGSEEHMMRKSEEEDSETLPPPAAVPLSEENGGSNEEISGSFPLPPSELCPSESEVSGPASPEPAQVPSPVVEAKDEISVPEISVEKTFADITETVSSAGAESMVAAGAGDGAPSD